MNSRRGFVIALLAMIGCSQREEPKQVAGRASPTTQPSRITRVVILYFGSGSFGSNVFRQRLSELGYIDGKTILIEERSADGDTQRLTQLARDLAASKVDVIVTSAVAATMAARQATSTIPIVMVHAGGEPSLVSAGLIASLAHPGGNVTGTTNVPLTGKNVDLIRELVPRVARIAILVNPTNAAAAEDVKAESSWRRWLKPRTFRKHSPQSIARIRMV